MVELFQKKSLRRDGKPSLLHVINRSLSKNSKKETHHKAASCQTKLGSDSKGLVYGSMTPGFDPYTPNLSTVHNKSLSRLEQPEKPHNKHPFTRNPERHQSSPELVTHRTNLVYHHQYHQQQQQQQQHYTTYSPASSRSHHIPSPISPIRRTTTQYQHQKPVYPFPSNGLSTPPLSPTNMSFATGKRSTWREMTHTRTYHPAPSISSAEDNEEEKKNDDDDDEDDDEPLAHLTSPFSSNSTLDRRFPSFSSKDSTEESTELSTEEDDDDDEEDDEDLVPIAALSLYRESGQHMSAAEKYKAKMKAKLHLGPDAVAASAHNEDLQFPDQPQMVNPFL